MSTQPIKLAVSTPTPQTRAQAKSAARPARGFVLALGLAAVLWAAVFLVIQYAAGLFLS
jgi:hypothetical protein